MKSSGKNKPSPFDTPPWRTSYRAVSPDGSVTAEMPRAMEHSMGNPTLGTLRMSCGLELHRCSPAFVWSDDSRYLAVPLWVRRFGLFLRQRLVIVDVKARVVHVSRFTYWLLQPGSFEKGRLEVVVSGRIGIAWQREEPLVLDMPGVLESFDRLPVPWNMGELGNPGS